MASVTLLPDGTMVIHGDETAAIVLTSGIKILSGDGSPSGSRTAPKGSLYLRKDGSTLTGLVFVNTNGGTSWSAISLL